MPDLRVSEKGNVLGNTVSFEERKEQLDKQAAKEEQARKNSPYSNWFQFNREHTADMIWLATNHPKAQAVLLFLLDQMDNYNAVMCSYQVIQEALGIGRTTASNAIKILKEKKFITILKSGTSNIYVVNKKIAWGSWGKNYKYGKFEAKIIISGTENKEYLDELETNKIKQVSTKGNN